MVIGSGVVFCFGILVLVFGKCVWYLSADMCVGPGLVLGFDIWSWYAVLGFGVGISICIGVVYWS